VSEWNDDGGVLGAQVEIETASTGAGQAQKGQEAGRRLVDQAGVDFLTGGFATEAILPVMNRIAGQGPVWVASSAGSAEVPNRIKNNHSRFKYFFTPTAITPTVMDSMTANLENIVQPDAGTSSVIPVREDLAWAQTFTDRLRDNASDVTVEDEIAFAFDTSDFSTILSEIEDSGADMAMMGMAVADAVSFVSQWAESETSVGLTGILPPATNLGFADQVGDAAIGVGPQQLGAPAPVTDLTLPFIEGYTEMFGNAPSSQSYVTYDAVTAMFNAVEMAGTIEPDPVVEQLEDYKQPGAVGTTQFQDDDDEFPHTPVIDLEEGSWYTQFQWQEVDGSLEYVMVGPDEWADEDGEHSFQLPPWM
jgi:ABC-type branched-subunit amino acid transport system substrate-binding protein